MELQNDENLTRRLLKKGVRLYILTFLIAPSGYIIRVLLSHQLSVADVWVFYSVIGLMVVLTTYNDLWLTQSLQYFLPKYFVEKKYSYLLSSVVWTLLVQLITASCIIAFLLRWGAERLAVHHFHDISITPLLRLVAWYFLGINALEVVTSIMRSFQKIIHTKVTDAIRMWSIVGFTLYFFVVGSTNVGDYLMARIAGVRLALLFGIVVFFTYYRPVFRQGNIVYDTGEIKRYVRYAGRIFLWANAGILFSQIDQQVIINMLWAQQAGYYSNYRSIINAVWTTLWPLISFIFPLTSELLAKNEMDKYRYLQSVLLQYLTLVSRIMAVFVVVMAPRLISVLFGSDFAPAAEYLRFTGWFIPLTVLQGILTGLLSWAWKIRASVLVTLIAAIFNLVSNILLIPIFWIYGVLWTTIVSWLLMCVFLIRPARKIAPITLEYGYMLKSSLFSIVLGALLRYCTTRRDAVLFVGSIYRDLFVLVVLAVLFVALHGLINRNKIATVLALFRSFSR